MSLMGFMRIILNIFPLDCLSIFGWREAHNSPGRRVATPTRQLAFKLLPELGKLFAQLADFLA
jgi:hypothetical protein